MTTLEKMDELCDEMDNDTSISEISALLEAIYRMTNDRDMGISETTLLYMARDWAKWAQDNFNAYTPVSYTHLDVYKRQALLFST